MVYQGYFCALSFSSIADIIVRLMFFRQADFCDSLSSLAVAATATAISLALIVINAQPFSVVVGTAIAALSLVPIVFDARQFFVAARTNAFV